MSGKSSPQLKAQLDKSEREHLEDVVTKLRETVESDIKYQLEHTYELNTEDGGGGLTENKASTRSELVDAVEREDGDKTWEEKFEQYVMGVGHTVVNRLTALRCMEVRGFIDRPVTQFGDSGTTPAAEKLEREEFLAPEKAIIATYERECEELANEIEILFDLESPYSLVDLETGVYKELCEILDEIPSNYWLADDVLGWVYEYYNHQKLSEIRRRARNEGIRPEDVAPANQFYTPHWVVRMLTDNALSKTYLERTGDTEKVIKEQSHLTTDQRKSRSHIAGDADSLADLSTYLVPSDTPVSGDSVDPSELKVIDPACGSGHFLLYAFDLLEQIWLKERPDLEPGEIPEKILENNIFGVDLDLRACQLASLNLYLKARHHAEKAGNDDFNFPQLNIACADAKVADFEGVGGVIDQVSGNQERIEAALETIVGSFENIGGLGSLLDVKETLSEEFLEEQTRITDDWDSTKSLSVFLSELQEEIESRQNGNSFQANELKSFVNLLYILSLDYDVALMNPPYGSQRRMPKSVRDYVKEHYKYPPEYYINFFEVCDRLVSSDGRIGMLVPRSFMYNQSFEEFRSDFIGERGTFDFLAEFGEGILDNATVRTVGTVVRSSEDNQDQEGEFFRLHDVEKSEKEDAFLNAAFVDPVDNGIKRRYTRKLSEFSHIPGYHISYWMSLSLRELYDSESVFDADNAGVDRKSLGVVKHGATTGDNSRFIRYFWEVDSDEWAPISKGGEDAWILPRINMVSMWGKSPEIHRFDRSVARNTEYFFEESLTYTVAKEGGRRFGYLHESSSFDAKGSVLIPEGDILTVLAYANSHLANYLMIGQTPDRMWQIGMVSKLPWHDDLADSDLLGDVTRSMIGKKIALRRTDINSPYYENPTLLDPLSTYQNDTGFYNHPHRSILNEITPPRIENMHGPESSLQDLCLEIERYREQLRSEIQESGNVCDREIFDHFDISDSEQEEILQEIALRTNNDPRDETSYDSASITHQEIDFEKHVKDLLLHTVLEIVQDDDDGIVPIRFEAEQEDPLIDRIEARFKEIFGEHAQDRMAEADQALGSGKPDSGAYPNIQYWLESELFDYQLQKLENTPVIWRVTTERLVSDPISEGFGCLVDYNTLDSSIFDRIESRYLEPLKAEYRKRRNVADQRRSDNTLSTSDQAEAAERFKRYEDSLAQLNEFQTAALSLSSAHPTAVDDEIKSVASELGPKVAEFRERTENRLETLDQLVEEMDPNKFEDHFSPTFLERVNDNREEWIDALNDLEIACEAYSKGTSNMPAAHLYDLFTYFDDLVGTTHYGSNGIFFMNYYFSKGDNLLDGGKPREGLEGKSRFLAQLAAKTDEDIQLGQEIQEGCDHLSKRIPSEWQERALQEVLGFGYNPIKKHGVAINILPLANQDLVPESVENKVI